PAGHQPNFGVFMRVPFEDILLLFILSFAFFLFGDNLIVAIFSERIEGQNQLSSYQYFLYLALSLLVDYFAIRFIILKKNRLTWSDIGLVRPPAGTVRLGILVGLLALPFTTLVDTLVQSFLVPPDLSEQRHLLLGETFSQQRLLLLIFLLGFLNPILQELLFRGVALNWLRSRMSPITALSLSAIFFGAAHGYLFLIPSLTALGFIFGLLVMKCGSLWPAAAAHCTYSCFQIMVAFQTLGVDDAAGASAG
ncbi:MAG: type II CAAX endopeptidase family protein, partial [Kiloniellales bacterium]|nr:type II CAAX endopeptidase family protein [Kiloniellales bacterium]